MTLEMLFSEILKIPLESVDATLSMETDKRWNSLKHFELVSAMERQYKVKFANRDIYNLKSFAQAREFLKRKGIAF